VGTIETRFERESLPATLTTPDFSVLQRVFSHWIEKGADAFVFEASSHAIDQGRLRGLELDMALFTNLTPEHLDYHKTMENYFAAKQKLFTDCLFKSKKKGRIAICPRDSGYGKALIDELSLLDLELWTWGESLAKSDRDLQLLNWETGIRGSRMSFQVGQKQFELKTPLIGKHNLENLMGVLCAGFAMKLKPSSILESLSEVKAIPGRLERMESPKGFSVFVDYAHTPDALENVLQSLRSMTSGKLKVVFGCGGDRDRQKRPMMGQIAELYADEIVVTSDNPRSENPHQIIEEILAGMQRIKILHIEADRKLAIEKSLENLKADDVVLIAGKGHETTQEISGQKIDFDDRRVVRAYLGV
jgi:UDP-N-acetylmuramoyl-L-alanyl-D-glutamate--2,6-diaminopimelate ligase